MDHGEPSMDELSANLFAWIDQLASGCPPPIWGELCDRLKAYAVDELRFGYLVDRFAASKVKCIPDAIAFCMAGELWTLSVQEACRLGLRFVELCDEYQSIETVSHLEALVASGIDINSNRQVLNKLVRMCMRHCDQGVKWPCDVLFDLLLAMSDANIPLLSIPALDGVAMTDYIDKCMLCVGDDMEFISKGIRIKHALKAKDTYPK
ncbi:hypothetical protein [Paludibaculum fermentans]|uniref:Uncharacterized protein n=1 Tax=Paludibaculum fermentans TaxID=1473598 RepID=A0A7S7SJF4_PALFE|nr:hypothetical protein [Paludibaculum fermentans]QOY86406.1 hypothetical protein IRI77_26890 [Paludibaculum fermentans]